MYSVCGFIQFDANNEYLCDVLSDIGCKALTSVFQNNKGTHNYYPAFGGIWQRQIRNLIIKGAGTESQSKQLNCIDATWWFDCQVNQKELIVNDRMTFNARNLESPFWKGALNKRRAIVLATAIGESQKIGKVRHHYLMKAQQPFLLGALYRHFENDLYSCAVITRNAHPKLKRFHEKSSPFFLPLDKTVVEHWLEGPMDSVLASYLQQPTLPVNLEVSRVKTFKAGEVMGQAYSIASD